jgi:hypothetical protein
MKKILSLFVLIFVMTMANVVNAKAENMNAQSSTSTVKLCVIAPIGTVLDFVQPSDIQMTVGSSSSMQEVSYTNIGGCLLYFTVSVPNNSSAEKVEIVCTINGFRESYSLENGQANIKAFIPIPSGKTAPMLYISVK